MRKSSGKKNVIKNQFIGTVAIVFLLMVVMIVYISVTYLESSVSYVEALGESNINYESAKIENYLQEGLNVLWVTADTVNNMMETGATNEEILQYLEAEANHQMEQIDENFTGIYGYIQGEYLDGIGWEPPADYEPKSRDWYISALEAGGKTTIVQPYLDAQTNTIMISVSQLLVDGESVVSLDIALNEIQTITENIQMENMGYGFIMDETGLVVAHFDEAEKGKVYPITKEQENLVEKIREIETGSFGIQINDEACTVFTSKIQDSWYVVMVVSNTKLFHSIRMKLCYIGLMCAFVFAMTVVFCTLSYKRMRRHQTRESESQKKLDELNTNIVRALAYTIDAKDRYTSGHSQRVANYSMELARRMGKSEEEQRAVYYAGLLHDVGKIRVPEDVINKPGRLTEEEFNQIKMHPVSGFHILKDIYEDKSIATGAKYHHERYDGKGYPNGLSGDNIPEIARIIGVADAYDAMASNRSYREALPQNVIRDEIRKCMGTQFDPEIAQIMLQMMDDDVDYQMRQLDSGTKHILIVDDELMNIRMVEFILKDEPFYDIHSVKSGAAALEYLDKENVDLVMLDIVMPDMDGFEVYKKLREKYHVPVIVMTADKNLDTIQRVNDLGIDDYITKPFLPIVLKETVHGVVNSWS